jgi:hypothetical protein
MEETTRNGLENDIGVNIGEMEQEVAAWSLLVQDMVQYRNFLNTGMKLPCQQKKEISCPAE